MWVRVVGTPSGSVGGRGARFDASCSSLHARIRRQAVAARAAWTLRFACLVPKGKAMRKWSGGEREFRFGGVVGECGGLEVGLRMVGLGVAGSPGVGTRGCGLRCRGHPI